MLKITHALWWGLFGAVFFNSVTAVKSLGNGVHPRFLNISGLLPPASSSSLDPVSTWLPQAPTGYCGLCIIEAPGGIRLVYWEPNDAEIQANVTANPNEPYTIVDNGFTYTSPSVYVIYSELQATVSATGACDLSASGDPVGPSFAAKTIGYSSRFLAYGTVTFPGPRCDEQYIEDGFHTIDFSELYYTPIVTSTVYKAGCAPYANPRLSLPAELTDVDPAWKTCQPLFYGAFDPPSVLSKASRLAPAQADPAAVTPAPPPVSAVPAVAQASPAAQTPAATPAPNNDGQKVAANDPPAPAKDTNDENGNAHELATTPGAPTKDGDPKLQEAGVDKNDPSGQLSTPSAAVVADSPALTPAPEMKSHQAAAANGDPSDQAIRPPPVVVANSPVQNLSPGADPNSQEAANSNKEPSGQANEHAAAVMVNPPDQSPAPTANVVVAQGATLTENGPPVSIGGKAAAYSSGSVYVDSIRVAIPTSAPVSPTKAVVAQGQTLTEGGSSANIGGKAAVYSAGSIYLGSSTPIAVPKDEDHNVVVAQGQTLTENGSTATIGGKVAAYSAGSVHYDSTPIPIPNTSSTNVVVAQGQTLSENGPSAIVGGKTALYKAGSVYYDSTPVAVPSSAQGQEDPPPVVAAGVTFAPTVQAPSPVVTNGITFAPALEKASPVVAGGITFAPVSQPVPEDIRDPVVAGGITFQPSQVRSPDSVALETPAPLSVGTNPVLKAANGGFIVAGSTISQGSTTSLLGHIIAANSENVVVDGTTHSLAPATAYPVESPTATPLEIANQPVLKAANGDLVIAGSTVSQGSTTSLLGHAIAVGSDNIVLDGTTHAFGPVTAHPLATPTPLEIANHPVFEAANGGLDIAGTTIQPGAQTSLFGHVISVGADHVVVDDGKTLSFAANTEQSVPSLVYGSSNTMTTTLTSGATFSSDGHIATYTGSTPSALTEATSSVIGTIAVPLQSSAQPGQLFIEASSTPEQLFVEEASSSLSSSSAVTYVLNGKTATAAAASGAPLGALILSGFQSVPTPTFHPSSALPAMVSANSTVASTPTFAVGSSSSEAGGRASPSRPVPGTGSRGMGCWLGVSGHYVVVLGYILGIVVVSIIY